MMYIGAPFKETLFRKAALISHKETSEGWLNLDYPDKVEFRESDQPLILEKGDSVAIYHGYQQTARIYAVYTVER